MSTDYSYANRAKLIKRAVALLAMAADKSSIHEASIAKKRADSLIKKHAISEKELILAGWKKPSTSNTQSSHRQQKHTTSQSTSSKQSAERGEKQAERQPKSEERATDRAYREWQEKKRQEHQAYQAWERARYGNVFNERSYSI